MRHKARGARFRAGCRLPGADVSGFAIVAALTIAVLVGAARTAHAEDPIKADLAIVSQSANVRHTRIGQEVIFTTVATNKGPEPAELDVLEYLPPELLMTDEDCGDVSADSPACEYGTYVIAGETKTIKVRATVLPTTSKRLTSTACVVFWGNPTDDPDHTNDCASAQIKIVGRGAP